MDLGEIHAQIRKLKREKIELSEAWDHWKGRMEDILGSDSDDDDIPLSTEEEELMHYAALELDDIKTRHMYVEQELYRLYVLLGSV